MRVLVTGGTGLLGNNIIRSALSAGHQVVALVRSSPGLGLSTACFEGLGIDIMEGSVTSSEDVTRAAENCDAILHSAAQIHIGWKLLQECQTTNSNSTTAVCEAALQRNIPLVHVSTVNTLSIPLPEQIADEETTGDRQVPCTYVVSKRASESNVHDAIDRGLRGMIVHPGFMLGPYDWKPSSGRMILEFAKTFTPVAPSGGCSVCDVRDVARGVLLALEYGKAGRHYILAGENRTYFDLWKSYAKNLGKMSPVTILRKPGQVVVGQIGDLISRFSSRESDLNSAAIRMSSQFHYYSSQRAIDELGYSIRSSEESIRDAVAWIQEKFLRG